MGAITQKNLKMQPATLAHTMKTVKAKAVEKVVPVQRTIKAILAVTPKILADVIQKKRPTHNGFF